MPASRITALLARQSDALAALQDDDARTLLGLAESARRELRERLDALLAWGADTKTPYTVQHVRVILAQTEVVVASLKQRMDAAIVGARPAAQRKALTDLLQVIRANERTFKETGNRIELATIARMARQDALLLHRYSLDRYGATLIARIQQEATLGLFQGATIPEITKRIAGTDGVFARRGYNAELIARMETNKAYNEGHHMALEEAATVLDDPGTDDPLMRQANEYMDARNDPVSRVIDGLVTAIGEPWMVPVAGVRAMEDRMKRKSGIVWPAVGAYYVIGEYPVHYNDRGRSIPYRPSWDNGAALKGQTPRQRAQLPEALRAKLAA